MTFFYLEGYLAVEMFPAKMAFRFQTVTVKEVAAIKLKLAFRNLQLTQFTIYISKRLDRKPYDDQTMANYVNEI